MTAPTTLAKSTHLILCYDRKSLNERKRNRDFYLTNYNIPGKHLLFAFILTVSARRVNSCLRRINNLSEGSATSACVPMEFLLSFSRRRLLVRARRRAAACRCLCAAVLPEEPPDVLTSGTFRWHTPRSIMRTRTIERADMPTERETRGFSRTATAAAFPAWKACCNCRRV